MKTLVTTLAVTQKEVLPVPHSNPVGRLIVKTIRSKSFGLLSAVVALSVAAQEGRAAVTLDVYASGAPNLFGSPSGSGYMSNALHALGNGLSTYGDPNSPTGYSQEGSTVTAGDVAATSFKSWRGNVNPTGAFANELGGRIHFGLHAYGDGTAQFRLQDLSWSLDSSDSGNSLDAVGNFGSANYNSTSRYGVNWGDDRVKGGVDDVVYTSGNGNTLVDELVYVGVGGAWWPGGSDPTPSNPVGGAQHAMDQHYSWVAANAPIDLSLTYSIGSYTGSDSVQVVPEPATLGMLGLAGLALGRRRRA